MNTRGLLLCDDTATCWWLQSHYMQAKHGTVKSSPRRGDCNGHTVNTWRTPSLLGLQYQSIVDLRSYLQVQLNQLRINHQCHIDAPVWTYALYKLSACYSDYALCLSPSPTSQTLVPQISYTVDVDHSRINGPPSQHRPAFAKDKCRPCSPSGCYASADYSNGRTFSEQPRTYLSSQLGRPGYVG